MFQYTLHKDKNLMELAFRTIPRNAAYACHDIQNDIIQLMASAVTQATVKEIGSAMFTIKVVGTRDPTGCAFPSLSDMSQRKMRFKNDFCAWPARTSSLLQTFVPSFSHTYQVCWSGYWKHFITVLRRGQCNGRKARKSSANSA